jgi:predicted dehydrogenase
MIGVGGIAQAHLAAWQKISDAEVIAIADIKPEALKKNLETWSLPPEAAFTDYKKMLDQVELDLVDVCTPNAVHAKPTIAGLKAGCHVLVEKPVAISAREVERMIEAGQDAKRLLMVAQVLRFGRDGQVCKSWVDQGLVGDIYWARAEYLRRRGVPPWGGFIDKQASAGGPCYDIGVHVLDMALHLMDFPTPVTVSAGTYLKLAKRPSLMKHNPRRYTVPEDFATAFVRFADGRSLSLGAAWALNLREDTNQVLVCGTKGGVYLYPATLVREDNGVLTNSTAEVSAFDNADMFYNECSAFVQAIREGGPSPVPGEQALVTQRILDAVYLSGAKGKEVKV